MEKLKFAGRKFMQGFCEIDTKRLELGTYLDGIKKE